MKPVSLYKIFKFWLPLASSWLMMAFEGPYIAAIIARMPDPKYNLAAYGVAFSFALIIESPIIMLLSATIALVKDADSFYKLRKFCYMLNAGITLVMLIFLFPPLFSFITRNLMELPEEVAKLVHYSTCLLLPWPAAIGFRRFNQGILIRFNLSRRVAYTTVIRLGTMSLSALTLLKWTNLPGAYVGTLSLAAGVTFESIACRIMAHNVLKQIKTMTAPSETQTRLTYRGIFHFYYPLALSSMLTMGANPMVSFFLGQSRNAIESLAVMPVINSLSFIFGCLGLAYQEVGIALLAQNYHNYNQLRRFAWLLGVILVTALASIAFTPLSIIWFHLISGLTEELTAFAVNPLRIISLMPGLIVMLAWQRSLLVNFDKTRLISIATGLEVALVLLTLFFTIHFMNAIGAVAATSAFIIGRTITNLFISLVLHKFYLRSPSPVQCQSV